MNLYFFDLINIAEAQAATGFQLTCNIKDSWLISYDGTKPYLIYSKIKSSFSSSKLIDIFEII